MPPPPTPVDSATVIVLREPAPAGCEVLLVERHAQSRAFAGASVFPGGIVDADDSDPRLLQASPHLTPSVAASRLGEAGTSVAALAFWIAAIRELFEETGLLLASGPSGLLTHHDASTRMWMRRHRQALLAGELAFADMVAREALVLRTDGLHCFSRWITPVAAPRRYDARFFVARVPDGQDAEHDERETSATLWITPRQAIARAQSGTLTLAPPTLRTLHDLDDLGTVAAILDATRDRRVTPILPKVSTVDGNPAILYPADADYDAATPGAVPTSSDATASGPRDRMVMEQGVWRSVRTPAPR